MWCNGHCCCHSHRYCCGCYLGIITTAATVNHECYLISISEKEEPEFDTFWCDGPEQFELPLERSHHQASMRSPSFQCIYAAKDLLPKFDRRVWRIEELHWHLLELAHLKILGKGPSSAVLVSMPKFHCFLLGSKSWPSWLQRLDRDQTKRSVSNHMSVIQVTKKITAPWVSPNWH